MAFPSPHLYLDPSNWHQQQNHTQRDEVNPQLPLPLPPLPSTTTIRPGSMADRARLANIPQPEPSLKCPRCDSTNTKFCYFNNYSLNQPRHFCKSCRRYWTRGGTLRNVPVGGGCRRNKRSKKTNSKASSGDTNTAAPMTTTSSNTLTQEAAALGNSPALPPLPYPFMGSMQDHPLGVYSNSNLGGTNIGLNYSGSRFAGDGGAAVEQWRTMAAPTNQQFPFMSGLDQTSVKMEGSTTQALINPRSNYGSSVVGQDHQFSWPGANMWNDHPFSHGFATPSTDQML